jgi:integrase
MGQFIDEYIAKRTDVKPNTATVYGHTRRNLIGFFGASKPLREITPGDADEWRISLMNQGLADNTVRRRCGVAKQFFNAAVRKGLIQRNPFADLTAGVRANPKRLYFVTRKEAEAVLDACPDAQWRLLFALSRYGGLRCPSEHLALRWADVDRERNRITVPSPKTEHHEGGASRQMPLFPELRPHLLEVFEEAEPGTEYVITRYRDTNANLRTQLHRIIKRAGLQPWPKLFHNLRATRQTELEEDYPSHVVCAWIGNSQAVAARHYQRTTSPKRCKIRCSRLLQARARPCKHRVPRRQNDGISRLCRMVQVPAKAGTYEGWALLDSNQ